VYDRFIDKKQTLKEEDNMANVTIFGKGSMGQAIGKNFEDAGNTVAYIDSETVKGEVTVGEIVVLAVPYPAVSSILADYEEE